MELQLIDIAGRFRFRINLAEPLWTIVRGALGSASPVPDVPDHDIDLDRAQLENVWRELAVILREHKEAVISIGARSGYDEVTITVLGETVRLNIRNPLHYEFERMNAFHSCIQEVLEAGLGLRLFVVPDLHSHQFRIASLLKRSPEGIRTADLKTLLQHAYDEQMRSTTSDEVRKGLERDVAFMDQAPVIAESIAHLRRWGLLVESSAGQTIHPSEKLRLILL